MKQYIKNMNIDEIFDLLEKGHRLLVEDCEGIYYKLHKGVVNTLIRVRPNDTTLNPILTINNPKLYFEVEELFEITETGLYKTRDGRRVFVSCIESYKTFPIKGVIEGSTEEYTWTKKGYELINGTHNTDIVSKWEE